MVGSGGTHRLPGLTAIIPIEKRSGAKFTAGGSFGGLQSLSLVVADENTENGCSIEYWVFIWMEQNLILFYYVELRHTIMMPPF